DHARGLLEPGGQFAQLACAVVPGVQSGVEQRVQGGDGLGDVGAVDAGGDDGGLQVAGAVGQVAAVDGEATEDLGEGVDDGVAVGHGPGGDEPGQPQDLGVQQAIGDGALGVVDHRMVALHRGDLAEDAAALGVHEEPVDVGERVVASGALAGPAGGQRLAGFEDLLDEQVGPAGELAEPLQVAGGIRQAVGVVDAQPVDQAVVEPAADLRVGFVEDPGDLNPQAGQRVHPEEAPVVQLVVGAAPVHQFVVLAVVDGPRVVPGRCGAGGHGEGVLVVAQLVPAVTGHQLQLVEPVVPQDGQPDPSGAGVPVDVEGLGVARLP